MDMGLSLNGCAVRRVKEWMIERCFFFLFGWLAQYDDCPRIHCLIVHSKKYLSVTYPKTHRFHIN